MIQTFVFHTVNTFWIVFSEIVVTNKVLNPVFMSLSPHPFHLITDVTGKVMVRDNCFHLIKGHGLEFAKCNMVLPEYFNQSLLAYKFQEVFDLGAFHGLTYALLVDVHWLGKILAFVVWVLIWTWLLSHHFFLPLHVLMEVLKYHQCLLLWFRIDIFDYS